MTPREWFTFKGRMSRKQYLPIYLPAFALIVAIGFIEKAVGEKLSFLTFLIVVLLIPPSVRRLHDIGYAGWLLIIIPLAVLLLLFAPGEAGSNAYGENPKNHPPRAPSPP